MNYTLAIEASTAEPTAALLHGEETLGEHSWEATRGATQRMFSVIHDLLEDHSATFESVDLFAVGLGPGGFTGLRLALSTLQALALPTRTNVLGISSAEAIALRVQRETTPEGRIVVVGDARRKRLWVGTFCKQQGVLQREGDFTLVPIAEFPDRVLPGDVIASPDSTRLGRDLADVVPTSAMLLTSDLIPTATDIALLARQRQAAGSAGEPLAPIYMHPPVFVEPRFTESTKRRL